MNDAMVVSSALAVKLYVLSPKFALHNHDFKSSVYKLTAVFTFMQQFCIQVFDIGHIHAHLSRSLFPLCVQGAGLL